MSRMMAAVASMVVLATTMCEAGWVLVKEKRTFDDARRVCRERYGTDLAGVDSNTMNNQMWDVLRRAPYRRAYVGLNDRAREGRYQWADGISRSFRRWRRGEPNNWGNEDCTEIGLFGDATWNDISCGARLYFFCTTRPRDFELVKTAMTFSDARKHCAIHFGSDLAVVPDKGTNDAMWQAIRQVGNHRAWIGYEDRSAEGKFEWVDGQSRSFKAWRRGEPNNVGGGNGEDCVEIGLFNDASWNDLPCHVRLQFFCDTRRAKSFVLVKSARTYAQANDYCKSTFGTTLATVPDLATNRAMWNELKRVGNKQAFIGLEDRQAEKVFRWASGARYTFRRWHRGEPNNVGSGGEDCTEMGRFNDETWNDINCGAKRMFFCDAAGPKGGVALDGDYVLVRQRKNFDQARRYCADKYGTDLAVVGNQARNTQMWNELRRSGYHYAWIGYFDKQQEGRFEWTDGLKRRFTKWHRGEPNNHGAGEDCAEMGFFKQETWNDMNCGTARYFFCAKAPVLEETETLALVQGKFTWQRAYDYCRSEFAAELASPRSKAENDAMNRMVNARAGAAKTAWLGVNDRRHRRRYVEADNQPLGYSNFAPGRPKSQAHDNCAQMGRDSRGRWQEEQCGDVADSFFCRKEGCPHNCPQCLIWGDPHFTTFDGKRHDFQGACAYHYVMGCKGKQDRKQVPFDVVGRHQSNGRVSTNRELIIRLFGKDGKLANELHVNNNYHVSYAKTGKKVQYDRPIAYDPSRPKAYVVVSKTEVAGRVAIRLHSAVKKHAGEFDLHIQVASNVHHSRIYISKAWQSAVCGLCGYFDNGNRNNDYAVWDGTKLNAAAAAQEPAVPEEGARGVQARASLQVLCQGAAG